MWHEASRLLLAGDQFLLGLKTPLRVADPGEDSMGGYLRTIDRVTTLEPSSMLTSHTEPIDAPVRWLERERRRLERQLERGLEAVRAGAQTVEQVTALVYRGIPGPGAQKLLSREQLAALRHLAFTGEVERRLEDGLEVFSAS